jgi:DNA-binding transcriptional ArsR family regulator
VFKALSDPGRRLLLDRLNARNGLSLSELCVDMGMTRQSVTKHLDVLEAADLVTTVRKGRERLHYLNAAPINDIADRWIHSYDRARAKALSDLKTALEATQMEQRTGGHSPTPPISKRRPNGSGSGSPTPRSRRAIGATPRPEV